MGTSDGKATNEKPASGNFKDLRKQKDALIGKPSGTYNLRTGRRVNLKYGFQVAFQTTSSEDKNSPNYLTGEQYDAIGKKLSEETGSQLYAGVFDETPEVSVRVKDEATALELIKKYKQHSAWDWANGKILKNPDFDEVGSDNVIVNGK